MKHPISLALARSILTAAAILAVAACEGSPSTGAERNSSSSTANGSNSAGGNSASTKAVEAPGVTQANFERIQTGMTHDEVSAILGSPGERAGETAGVGITSTVYQWSAGTLGGSIICTFMNGRLDSKTQIGL